jgi:hypothetical protein
MGVIPRRVLLILITAACIFPVAIVIVVAVGRLLGAMQDTAGAAVLDRLALALGMAWALNLVCLLLVQGINGLGKPPSDG